MKDTVVPAATAVMSSFNRIGATWAGGHYGLLTGVLRDEWGFNGFVLTDYESTSYMHTLQCLAAGGDGKLTTVDWGGFSLEDHPAYQGYGREAVHHILYTVVNSAGMNGFVHGVQYHNGFAYYKFITIAWDAVMLIILVALAFVLVKKHKVHGAAPTKK